MAHTILLADDSVTIRRVVELTFSDTDIRVETVSSGREALERFRAVKPDLVLADVIMPPPAGYELCRAIKESERPVPVLLLAGTFEPFDPDEAEECMADGHLVKPFESSYLVQRVTDLLSSPPPPPVVEKEPEEFSVREPSAEEQPEEIPADEPEPVEEPAAAEGSGDGEGESPARLDPADIDTIAAAVVEKLSERVLRDIAWEVVPDLAETLIRERIRQIEREDLSGRSK